MRTHKDLEIWQRSMNLMETIYSKTQAFPQVEMYGLTSQIRRSSVSVPSNIAEGAARQTSREFIQFLYIALGSLSETETLLMIAERLGYIKDESIMNDIEIIRRQLLNFLKYREPLIIINLSLPRRRESSDFKSFWIPAFAGMTLLEAALKFKTVYLLISSPQGERIKVRGNISRAHPHPSPLPPETVSQFTVRPSTRLS